MACQQPRAWPLLPGHARPEEMPRVLSPRRVFSVQRVQKGFSARIACARRTYTYYLPAWLLVPGVARRRAKRGSARGCRGPPPGRPADRPGAPPVPQLHAQVRLPSQQAHLPER